MHVTWFGKRPEQRFVASATGLIDEQKLDDRSLFQLGGLGTQVDTFRDTIGDQAGQHERVGISTKPLLILSIPCVGLRPAHRRTAVA